MQRCLMQAAVVSSLALLVVLGGTLSAGASSSGSGKSSTRCPAPGEALDDATSTAPPRHTPEELASIRKTIEAELLPPGRKVGPLTSIGDGRDTIEIDLVPCREDLAANLVNRYGDALRIHVGS